MSRFPLVGSVSLRILMNLSNLLKSLTVMCGVTLVASVSAASAQERPVVRYTPQQLIAIALRQNLDLEYQRIEEGIKDDQISGAWGEFEPSFMINAGINRSNRAQNQREFLSTGQVGRVFEEEVRRLTMGIGGRLPFGTTYEATTGVQRFDNTSNRTQLSIYNPEYQSTTVISITQPLLRNFGRNTNMAALRVLQSEMRSAKAQTRSAIEQVVAEVLAVIYELRFAEENIQVKEQSIELAQSLLNENRRRVEEGRMSPIDVTQAEVRLAEAREELITARNFHAARQNRLQELLGRDFNFEAPFIQVDGVDALSLEQELNHGELARVMMTRSPIYESMLEMVEAEGVRVAYMENQAYPEVDLQMSIGWNGLSDYFTGSYRDYENRSEADWGVGISINIPLGNRTARARVSEAKRRQTQALLDVKRAEVQLLSALDTAIRDVRSGLERRELIQESVRLAEAALVSEERRLATGMTTSYNVLNQQRELTLARTRALAADVDVQQAWAQLLLIQGTLAPRMGFAVNISN